jgi:hypothetical protein
MSSRDASEYFMPKWPIAMPSQMAPPTFAYQTLNPSAFNSSRTMAPIWSRCACPGIWLVYELITVTNGFFKSSSEWITPSAIISAAAGSMCVPSAIMRLPFLRIFSMPSFIRSILPRVGSIMARKTGAVPSPWFQVE